MQQTLNAVKYLQTLYDWQRPQALKSPVCKCSGLQKGGLSSRWGRGLGQGHTEGDKQEVGLNPRVPQITSHM